MCPSPRVRITSGPPPGPAPDQCSCQNAIQRPLVVGIGLNLARQPTKNVWFSMDALSRRPAVPRLSQRSLLPLALSHVSYRNDVPNGAWSATVIEPGEVSRPSKTLVPL